MGFFDRFKDIPIDDNQPSTPSADAEPANAADTPADSSAQQSPIEFGESDTAQITGATAETPLQEPRRKRSGLRRFFCWFVFVVVVVIGVVFYIRYLNPYVTDAKVRGYVNSVERRGIIFKTFEMEMVSDAAMADSGRVYSRDCYFSIDNDSLAARLQRLQGTGERVVVSYETFYGTLPWRGASRSVATAVEVL